MRCQIIPFVTRFVILLFVLNVTILSSITFLDFNFLMKLSKHSSNTMCGTRVHILCVYTYFNNVLNVIILTTFVLLLRLVIS